MSRATKTAPALRPEAEALRRLESIARQMVGQENHLTSWPIYLVQREELVPTDDDYADNVGWYSADEFHPEEDTRARRLEALYQAGWRTLAELEDRWFVRRVVFLRKWVTEGIYLTHAEAKFYADRDHRDFDGGRRRVYVDSAYRSQGLRAVMELLSALAGEPLPGVPPRMERSS